MDSTVKAVVANRSWTGHGEGGVTAHVQIEGGVKLSNAYDNSNADDQAKVAALAEYVNDALKFYAERNIS